jgi:hypothetical protein
MFVRQLSVARPFNCAGIDFAMLPPREATNSVEIVCEILRPGTASPTDRHSTIDPAYWIPRSTSYSLRCVSDCNLLCMNVWGQSVPEEEMSWRSACGLIHERRNSAAAVSLTGSQQGV